MANMRIGWRNFLDEATVSASEAATEFPASNTQNDGRDDAWRSTTTGTVTMSWTWSRDRVFDYVGIFRHRNQGSNVRWEFFSDAAWTTAAAGGDTGTVAFNKVVGSSSDTAFATGDDPYGIGQYDPLIAESPWWNWFASPVTARSARATFSSHVTTYWNDAFWHIGRIVAGKAFSPRINPSYDGNGLTWADNTTRKRTLGGSLRSNVGARWREVRLQLDGIDENEVPVWMDIMATAQTGRAVMVSLFPEDGTRKERDNMILGKFESLGPLGRRVGRLTKSIALIEL